MKKVISLLMVVIMVVAMIPPMVYAEDVDMDVWTGGTSFCFSGGDGTEENPYIIWSAADLAYLAKSVNEGNSYSGQFFALDRDLDLNNIPWTPIGTEAAPFFGTFNGDNHTIKNLYIDLPDRDFVGLFGFGVGQVSSLRITDFSVTGHDYVGAFSGRLYGFVGCTLSSGRVNGNDWVGGICGGVINDYNVNIYVDSVEIRGASHVGGAFGSISPDYWAEITNCTVSNSKVSGRDCVGGILGSQYHGSYNTCLILTNCHNINTSVSCVNDNNEDTSCCAGGIIGGHFRVNSQSQTRIHQCSNQGNVSAENVAHRVCVEEECSHTAYAGGIIGYASWTGPNECVNTYNTGKITSVSGDAGGIYGMTWRGGNAMVINCHNVGKVKGKNVYGIAPGGTITDCFYLTGSDNNAKPLTSAQFADASNFTNWDFENIWIMSSSRGYPVLRTPVRDVTSQYVGKQIKIKSEETGKYVSGQNEAYLHASFNGASSVFTVTPMTEDGWVGFRLVGGNYITVSDDENHLQTTAPRLSEWECFRIYEYMGYHYLLSHKDMKYVQVTKGLAGMVRWLKTEIEQGADLTDATWERFHVEIVGDVMDPDDITDPFIKAHVDFYQNKFEETTRKLSFTESKAFVAGKSATAAYKIWDAVGDFGKIIALSSEGISMNYYDVFMSEFILQMTGREDELFEQECFAKKAKSALKAGETIAQDVATVIAHDDQLLSELNDLNKDWKKILHWEDLVTFKGKLHRVFSEEDYEMTKEEKALYDKILSRYLSRIDTESVLGQFEAITTVVSTVSDSIDAANKIYKAYAIAESTAEINDEFFEVFRDVLVTMLSKPGTDSSSKEAKAAAELLDVLDEYYKIATDKDAMFEYILEEIVKSTAVVYWENFQIKESLKELGYRIIGEKLKVGLPQVKALVATYNGTYKLLDAALKLNDKKDLYFLMSCISPIEGGFVDMVDSYGRVLQDMPTVENTQRFDYAFYCLKEMNDYLYTCLHNYSAYFDSAWNGEETRDAAKTLMSFSANKRTAWNSVSCHSEDVVEPYYKTVTISCPGDIYVFDKDDNRVASVINEVTTIIDSSVSILVSNEVKTVTFPASLDYRVSVVAHATGEMEFDVADVDPYHYDETNAKNYTGIQLNASKEIIADVGASTPIEETRLVVLDEQKIPEKEILANGQEVAYSAELPTVTGRVFSHSSETPVVIVLYAQGDRTTPLYKSVATQALGDVQVSQSFRVPKVALGTYDMVIRKQGYLSYEREVTFADSTDISIPDVYLLDEPVLNWEYAYEYTAEDLGSHWKWIQTEDADATTGKSIRYAFADDPTWTNYVAGIPWNNSTMFIGDAYSNTALAYWSKDALNANSGKGYQLYKFEDITLGASGYNWINLWDNRNFDGPLCGYDASLMGKVVDLYVSLKMEGTIHDTSTWDSTDAAFYIDRVIIVESMAVDIAGDINGDGETNLKDLSRLFQYLADWDVEVNEAVLDVNGDGSVNLKDQTRLFQYLADWDVEIYPAS